MKRLMVVLILIGLFVFSGSVFSQETGKMPGEQAKMMEMMKDSTKVKRMMEHIATDDHMRKMMMQHMMNSVKSDSSGMMEMCKMMMGDHDMHDMMMKLMEGGMMKEGMHEKNTTDEKMENEDHENHHLN